MPKFLVTEVQFKTAVHFSGSPQAYLQTGPNFPGYNVYVDTVMRELVVEVPNSVGPKRRVHVPLENVSWYRSGVQAPKDAPGNNTWAKFPDE